MPHVIGTARLSPRSSVRGRVTPSRLARRCVNDSQTPSSTRAPSRASCPTLHVPIASRSRTSAAPTSQMVARIIGALGRAEIAPLLEGEAIEGALAPASIASLPAAGWALPTVGAIGADAAGDLSISD